MGVKIRGMKLPDNCMSCPFLKCWGMNLTCIPKNKTVDARAEIDWMEKQRADWCPMEGSGDD